LLGANDESNVGMTHRFNKLQVSHLRYLTNMLVQVTSE